MDTLLFAPMCLMDIILSVSCSETCITKSEEFEVNEWIQSLLDGREGRILLGLFSTHRDIYCNIQTLLAALLQMKCNLLEHQERRQPS